MSERQSMKGQTLLRGHELVGEGMPFSPDGRTTLNWMRTGGEGCAKCRCGALSPVLSSANARKRWHREHKDEIRAQRRESG